VLSLDMDVEQLSEHSFVGSIRGTKLTATGKDFFDVYWALVALARGTP
jgi:hypothetical protein